MNICDISTRNPSKNKLKPLLSGLTLIVLWLAWSCQVAYASEPEFVLHSEKPAIARGGAGAWDSAYLDPGTVIYHDDTFHMFYVAIPRWPHPMAIGYATSADGHEWTRQSDAPVVTHDQTGALAATSIMSTSALVTDDGTWVLYFTSVAPEEAFYGQVGRATALDPHGPWTVDPKPVLTPGPEGAWDALAVGDASVVRTADGYKMYYAGFGNFQNGAFAEKRANIGMATSEDGVRWTKFNDPTTSDASLESSDPILGVNTDEAAWDTFRVVDPNVQQTPDGWMMIYRGSTFNSPMAVGLATSYDGVNWRRASDTPIMTERDVGKRIIYTTLLSRPEQDFLFLEMGNTNNTEGYLATRLRVSE